MRKLIQITNPFAPLLIGANFGTSASAVARVWRAHGFKPHRVESFKLSNDTHFIEKLEDIVGLYLDPPELALVLCCDEKTQIQALDRMQQRSELEAAINEHIAVHNAKPKPFIWTAKASDILAKATRARATLNMYTSN